MARAKLLMDMFRAMEARLEPGPWRPAESPFEVMLGSLLTQNAAWANVKKALANLRRAGLLEPRALDRLSEAEIAEYIRPSGFYRVKARRLKIFLAWLRDRCGYDVAALEQEDAEDLRAALLNVPGVGPETADSMLLYALGKPCFVVDACTRRMFSRHGLVPEDIDYHELRDFFMDALQPDPGLFQAYHAHIVRICQQWCKKTRPLCEDCPMRGFLDHAL